MSKKPGDYLREKRNKRKEALVKFKGGKCQICGYSKSFSALVFHHKNHKNKKFNISGTNLTKFSYSELLKEVKKCDLLCANCHAEIHDEILDKEGWIHENGNCTPKEIKGGLTQ